MKKMKSQLALAIVCCVFGFILTYQLKTVAKQEKNLPVTDNADITEEIERLKEQKKDMTGKIDELQKKIDNYEKESSKNTESNYLYNELKKTRMIIGEVDVEGPGVVIKITPNNLAINNSHGIITHEQLISIINELNFADAEAISINDIRVTLDTGIRSSSQGDVIWIGSEKISPYKQITIKAIGNSEKLYQTIAFPRVFKDVPTDTYMPPTYEKKDLVKIPKSNELKPFEYSKEIKDN